MKFLMKFVCFALIAGALLWSATVVADSVLLHESVVRLHVVANSDSDDDQTLKLKVRDAVIERLQSVMASLPTAEEAKAYLQNNLEEIRQLANRVLAEAGSKDQAEVTLQEECFDFRQYDTFALPAGVYDALRITIGEGQGKNWWCVVFPTLCAGATSQDFTDTAAGSGFGDNLTEALKQEKGYEVRFYFLDLLGKLQNFFFRK